MSVFSTITAYIASFEPEKQKILKELYTIIKNQVPKETTETISYQMPTFRYNGNLIHFAMYKNHLGLYPGAETIESFKEDLKTFKTSKGAIQIPLDQPLPKNLIEKIVSLNIEKLQDKTGPNWHIHRDKWMDADSFMQQLIEKTNLQKTFKWGTNVYTHKNKNVIAWGGFKNFFSLWFYNGVFLKDSYKVLVAASQGKTKALRQWRFTDVNEMDEFKILEYITESIITIDEGLVLKSTKAVDKKPEGVFKIWLDENDEIKQRFEQLTPGRQREYITYIEEAKQDKTKYSRLEKIKPLILNNQGLNEKYKTK